MGSHESSNRRFPVSLPLQLLFMSIHQTACQPGNLYGCKIVKL